MKDINFCQGECFYWINVVYSKVLERYFMLSFSQEKAAKAAAKEGYGTAFILCKVAHKVSVSFQSNHKKESSNA